LRHGLGIGIGGACCEQKLAGQGLLMQPIPSPPNSETLHGLLLGIPTAS
jgi:hypothetical protein